MESNKMQDGIPDNVHDGIANRVSGIKKVKEPSANKLPTPFYDSIEEYKRLLNKKKVTIP